MASPGFTLFFIPFSMIQLFLVPNEINVFSLLIFFKVLFILFHSIILFTSLAPGLVDSPPISKILDPLFIRFLA